MSVRKEIVQLVAEAEKSGARRRSACSMLDLNIRTLQRWEKKPDLEDGRNNNRFVTSNALTPEESQQVIDIACSPEFRDKSPNQIVPILAENGKYIASESTFHRFLKKNGLLTHRSKAKAPERKAPEEKMADGSNQAWTWDITYLLTFCRGTYFYLYLMLDIWDRSIVGWSLHEKESGEYAGDLLSETCVRQGVQPGELTVHQDNGSPMISYEFLAALSHWGQASYSRPGVSDDNPYSESHFRTLKYRPNFPERFETIEEAIAWIQTYVEWYNTEHRHSGIGFVTPFERRSGKDIGILERRRQTYESARQAHPERWSKGIRKWNRPGIVALNPRDRKKDRQQEVA